MYNIEVYEGLQRVQIICKNEEKQLLSNFLSDFDQTCFCELASAVEKIKKGTLNDYGQAMDLYFFNIDSKGIFIGYGENYSEEKKNYSFEELEEAIHIYVKAMQENFGVDLTSVDADYEPMVEGIIDESNTINDTRVKRF